MKKREFIIELQQRLSGLPKQDVEERISFYCEMIDDRIDEGYTEEEAVLAMGSVDEIASQILSDIPLTRITKEKIRPKRRIKAWKIVLLALGSPIWLCLIAAGLAVILSVYIVLWSAIVSLWAVFGSLVGCAAGGLLGGIALAVLENGLAGLALIGAAIACAGIAIFFFFSCAAATNGAVWLTKKIILGLKKCFVGRGENQ